MAENEEVTDVELSQRILALLEEFGEENIFSMINSIIDPTGAPKEVKVFTSALQRLLDDEHISMAYETFVPRVVTDLDDSDTIELLSGLARWFRFDATARHWTLATGDMRRERIPEICLTDAGRGKAVEILNQRGVDWWRLKSR